MTRVTMGGAGWRRGARAGSRPTSHRVAHSNEDRFRRKFLIDHGTYDAPAPTVRRNKDDLDGLHSILRNHMEDLSETEREIIHEAYFEGQPRDEIAARRGISLNTYDNHRKAACRKLRESMMAVVDFCADIDLRTGTIASRT